MVVVSTAKVVHHVDRHGDGSRSAHTQDEMDIYVNDGYLVNMTRHCSTTGFIHVTQSLPTEAACVIGKCRLRLHS